MSRSKEMIPDTFCFCPRCACRVEIGRLPLGSMLECWSCGHSFVVDRGTEGLATTGQGRGEKQRLQEEIMPDDEGAAIIRMPPLRLFFSGTFRFPFYLSTLSQTLGLSLGGIVLAAAVRLALWCYSADLQTTDPYTRVLLANGLLFSIAIGGVFAVVCACLAAASAVTIVQDTSHGANQVENWPNLLRWEGWSELLCLANATMLSALPGLLAAPLWHWLGLQQDVGIALTAPLLFPILLLSMLESRSPVAPVSPPVWRSLVYAWIAWLAFYVTSFTMAAATVMAVAIAVRAPSWTVGTTASGILPAIAWIVYFRLLGRLAWFCSGRYDR